MTNEEKIKSRKREATCDFELYRVGNIIWTFDKQCPVCKLDFFTANPHKIYCSEECRKIAKRERERRKRNEKRVHIPADSDSN